MSRYGSTAADVPNNLPPSQTHRHRGLSGTPQRFGTSTRSKLGGRCAVELKSASLTDFQNLKRLIKSYYAFDRITWSC
jgi:hypothetical protein